MDGMFKNPKEIPVESKVEVEEEESKEEEELSYKKTKEKAEDNNSIYLEFNNTKYTIENIKGTKLYYLYLRNGECARLI